MTSTGIPVRTSSAPTKPVRLQPRCRSDLAGLRGSDNELPLGARCGIHFLGCFAPIKLMMSEAERRL